MSTSIDAADRVLTINTGSSSLKVAVFATRPAEALIVAEEVERTADPAAALRAVLERLRQSGHDQPLAAVAHRIVHGGPHYQDPQLITAEVLGELRTIVAIDPDHMPQALAAIQVVTDAHPTVPQIACFDTAFHRALPRVAQMYALPRHFRDAGVRRYGFHGLSCEYIVSELARTDRSAATGRVVIAHLGSGASLTAVRDGRSVETTMGFSPTGGVIMGTRSGDLDPGVLLYALQRDGMSADAISMLLNREAGLAGVSETSSDMRDLLARESTDSRAADAIALFCYAISKSIGALMAALGGLDTLIFTAGIGEHAAPVRARVCAGLSCFGIELDAARNDAHAPIISRDGGRVVTRVMKTDEDLMLARHARLILSPPGSPSGSPSGSGPHGGSRAGDTGAGEDTHV
jgi:acetate kinase